MTVISTEKDTEALTLTFVAEFDADIQRVWRVWEDPRQLERWWGPPTWPATFQKHDFTLGGRSLYYMTGPDGEKPYSWWVITALDAPNRLEYDEGFADENGEPDSTMGAIHNVVTLDSTGQATRMSVVATFENAEQLQQMLEMGMEEGMRSAMRQIDALLADVSR
ncbi:MAG: SRPBCC domain-containing protein [Microbacteriaceae bacterium]